ncbi:sialidase family protein [Aquimarina rhabdastrellae]
MLNRFYLAIGLLFLCSSCIHVQHSDTSNQKTFQKKSFKNVKIYESTGNGLGPCEPSIFINPKNPKAIVAGSIIDFVHHSNDGGATWQTKRLSSSLGIWGDPVITADTKGNFYYFHLSDPDGTNWKSNRILDRMVVQKSTDDGNTWTDGIGIGHNPPKQQDKEWATVNPKTNEIYLTWTEFDQYGSDDPNHKTRILFSSSKDEGDSWSTPIAINQFDGNCIDDNNTVEGAVPASDGKNIYVAWSYKNQIWFDKSTDNGKTWLDNDIIISPQKSGWTFNIPSVNRTNGMPVTAVDNSDSPYKGTIYVNWTDQLSEENTDVFIAKSTDEGKTWSKPIRVNTDQTQTHQFLTWMSVDPSTGYIYIIYYDRSAYTDSKTDVVLAVSKNGGKTFTNTTISDSPFDPTGCPFFGDYNNISAHNGIVRPIWTRYENNKLSIWTSLIDDTK